MVTCCVVFRVKSFTPPGPDLSLDRARNIGIDAAMMVTADSAIDRTESCTELSGVGLVCGSDTVEGI
jgi:hypothetical protein